ncbi:MAG: T9SS type A sorting domain-containing protein [Sphingobacteriales bacterium]|nr:T9SS type A sorting domain-containing protein [Sphingobacteriales bacterium]
MSTKIKIYLIAGLLFMTGAASHAQTAELATTSGSFAPGSGPVTSSQGPISLMRDNNPLLNVFTPLTGSNVTTVTMALSNQQYTGLPYSNISTGLVFGAQPTTATGGTTQQVDPGNIYAKLGDFLVSPGGPTDNFYTAASPLSAGTGIVTGATFVFPTVEPNGAAFLFTNAQWQFNIPGGPSVHNSTTRYYYGDLVITFNRFIANPVIHFAGLGGSYRYCPAGLDPTNTANWLSTFFSTELDIVGFTGTKLSGNTYFTVSGSSITNNAATPNGASVSTVGSGTLFDEIGAASGSVRINAAVKTITLKVYLRGCTTSNFPWSALGSASGGTRNPLTGDIWGVSVSSELSQLITLPVTGTTLTAALNGNDVSLNWKTVTELNSKQFEIERSTDGINYTQIGVKAAAGYSTAPVYYYFSDPGMTANAYYYRLKMVDLDGKYTYSNVAIVRKTSGIKGIKAFPNPATDNLNLEFSNAKGDYVISVLNQSGQEVRSIKATIKSSVEYVNIEKGSLATGMYIINVRNINNGETFVERVIFQK